MKHKLVLAGTPMTVTLTQKDPMTVTVAHADSEQQIDLSVATYKRTGRIRVADRLLTFFVTETHSSFWVTLDGSVLVFDKDHGRAAASDDREANFAAPMPGKIIQVAVAEGDEVEKGTVLVIMEAMKMEHRIEAPSAGVVVTLRCAEGELVEQGYALLDFEPKTEV